MPCMDVYVLQRGVEECRIAEDRKLRKQDKNGAPAAGEAVEIEGTNSSGGRSRNVTPNLVVLEDASIGGKNRVGMLLSLGPTVSACLV